MSIVASASEKKPTVWDGSASMADEHHRVSSYEGGIADIG